MGGVMLNFEAFAQSTGVPFLGVCGAMVILIASLLSLLSTILVIAPFIKKNHNPDGKLSMIFHEEILARSCSEYIEDCKTSGRMIEDIGKQTYMLAKGLRRKYKHISVATKVIMFGHMPGFTLLVLSFIGS